MRLVVISDTHIENSQDPIYAKLLRVIREAVAGGDVLVLNGDVFEVFVGATSFFRTEYGEFIQALFDAAHRGVDVHYVEGNHDFQLSLLYGRSGPVAVHKAEVSLEIGSKRVLVAHGDLADASDLGYRALRFLLRNPVSHELTRLVPSSGILGLWAVLKKITRSKMGAADQLVSGERLQQIRELYRGYAERRAMDGGYDFVILGHCHDLDGHRFDGGKRQYINMGFPRAHGTYLVLEEGSPEVRRVSL